MCDMLTVKKYAVVDITAILSSGCSMLFAVTQEGKGVRLLFLGIEKIQLCIQVTF